MTRSPQLGAMVGLACLAAAPPASADVPVTVTPVHGRTYTTFAVKFKPRVRSGRYRNALRIAGPVPVDRHHCRHPMRNETYTPGETPLPPHRKLRWRFGPRAVGHVAANGDFDFRPQRTVGPLRRWSPGPLPRQAAWPRGRRTSPTQPGCRSPIGAATGCSPASASASSAEAA